MYHTYLGIFAILDILLSVQEPIRNLVLTGVAHDGNNFFNLKITTLDFSVLQLHRGQKNLYLFIGALAGSFVEVNIGLLQDDVGITTTHTFDGCQGELHLSLAIDVGTDNTENVLKFLWYDQRLELDRSCNN